MKSKPARRKAAPRAGKPGKREAVSREVMVVIDANSSTQRPVMGAGADVWVRVKGGP